MTAIVVGAGVSGLTAAADLRAAGVDVVVVEARDRIGGRTWTADVAGVPVDLGGSWIHGPSGNPLAAAVRAAGLRWRNDGVWGTGLALFGEDGAPCRHDVLATMVAAMHDFDLAEAAAQLPAGASLLDATDWYVRDRDLEADHADIVRFALEWLEGGLNIGAPPSSISAAGAAAYELHGGGNVVVEGGYRSFVDHLAAGLDVRTDTPVRSIDHGRDGCTVRTDGDELAAEHVVVTVPLGVLQRRQIAFTPAIPLHEAAADRLAMANLEKVVVRFGHPPWPPGRRRATFWSDDRRFPSWIDMSRHAGGTVLIGFYNPYATPGMADRSLDERAELALDVLRRMQPDLPDPIEVRLTDWTNDPWAYGSYSYVPVGGSPDDMAMFATSPSRRLHFAGEHTVPRYFGTVHAALVSGHRAADAVLAAHQV